MTKTDERGFALVEAVAALLILIPVISGVFAAVCLCVAQAWLKDAAEEAALCVAERVAPLVCKKELVQKTRTVLPVGEFIRLSVEKYESRIVVKYIYQTLEVSLENEQSLQLPVSKRAVGKL